MINNSLAYGLSEEYQNNETFDKVCQNVFNRKRAIADLALMQLEAIGEYENQKKRGEKE